MDDEAVGWCQALSLQRSHEFGETIAVKDAKWKFAPEVNLPRTLPHDLAQKMTIADDWAQGASHSTAKRTRGRENWLTKRA